MIDIWVAFAVGFFIGIPSGVFLWDFIKFYVSEKREEARK